MSVTYQPVAADGPARPAPQPGPADPGGSGPTETSLISRFVAVLTPVSRCSPGRVAGYVAKHIPGVALDPSQIVAFMIAASTAALSGAWQWLQGWQQHEQLVADGKTRPVKPGPAVAAGQSS